MRVTPLVRWAGALSVLVAGAGTALAGDVTFNGFISAFGGKALETADNPNAFPCNCAIADYPFVGIYEDEWTFDPDTTFGFQANFAITDKLTATGQIVAHGARGYEADIQWAYLGYAVSDTWTLQAGRKRLPLFYYSDFFDVGYAMPWVRAPGDLYGWQIVGYDGANMLFNDSWGDVGVTANVWFGRDDDDENPLLSEVYYGVRVDETWKDMLGGYLDLSKDWFNFRIVYMTNKVDREIYADVSATNCTFDGTTPCPRLTDAKQNFAGIAFNVDYNDLVIRSEYNTFERPSEDNKYKAALIGVGYRLGDFLPMITASSFEETATWTDIEKHDTRSFSLRWDFASSAAFKIQYDVFTDDSTYYYVGGDGVSDFIGDYKLIAFGVDVVF